MEELAFRALFLLCERWEEEEAAVCSFMCKLAKFSFFIWGLRVTPVSSSSSPSSPNVV